MLGATHDGFVPTDQHTSRQAPRRNNSKLPDESSRALRHGKANRLHAQYQNVVNYGAQTPAMGLDNAHFDTSMCFLYSCSP